VSAYVYVCVCVRDRETKSQREHGVMKGAEGQRKFQ
jgi:hypothetical protein